MPHPAMVTNTGQSQAHTLCPSRMISPVGRVYMPMISGAKPVAFIALKNAAQRRGWAAWESPKITSNRANQASMYGAIVGLLGRDGKGRFREILITKSLINKTNFLVSKNF